MVLKIAKNTQVPLEWCSEMIIIPCLLMSLHFISRALVEALFICGNMMVKLVQRMWSIALSTPNAVAGFPANPGAHKVCTEDPLNLSILFSTIETLPYPCPKVFGII
jgi:hypothetical protein